MRRVLFDINVLLDVLLRREPHFAASAAALDAVGRGLVEGYLAAHAVTTIAYLVQRQVGRTAARAALADLLARLRVAAVTESGVRLALGGAMAEFEDAVTYAAALEVGADAIITRNVADFTEGGVPAVLPELFLAGLGRTPG